MNNCCVQLLSYLDLVYRYDGGILCAWIVYVESE